MERGIIKTTIKGYAITGTWTIGNIEQINVSPVITFDAFQTFKIMVRFKEQFDNHVVSYFIQTKGVYGVLPKLLTVLVGRGPIYPNPVNFVPDKSWTKTGDEQPAQDDTTVYFKIKILKSHILKFDSPNFSNIREMSGADIIIEASDGKQTNVHKTVLLARSDVLRAMWQNDMLERTENRLKIPELDEDSLNLFVSYLYCGTIDDCNLKECLVLQSIADKYNIQHLARKCQNILQTKLSKDNAIAIFLYADLHNLQNLKALSTECILTNMETIVLTNAWRETIDASFFKNVYQDLVKIENRVVTDEVTQAIHQTNHCLKVKFPIDMRHRSDRLYQISPESGYGTFIFRVLERDATYFKLSVCQFKYDDDYLYTNVNFTGEVTCEDKTPMGWTPASATNPNVPIIAVNEWYDIASFKRINNLLTITLEISYDIKYKEKNCAFAELLTDSSSADMTLESSDGVFRQVHKSVLIARNLCAMVNQCDAKDNLKLCDLSALALNEFINCIYMVNDEQFDIEFSAELLVVTNKYDLPVMKYECEAKLKTLINTSNALELLSLAVSNKAVFLEQWVLDFVHLNNLEIIETENWRNFNICDLIKKLIDHHIELKELCTMTT